MSNREQRPDPERKPIMWTRLTSLVLAGALIAPAQFSVFPDKAYWKEQWQEAPYQVEIEPVAKLSDYLADGELHLSLRAYLELVMANNADINLQKLAVYEQENAIQRALSPFDPAMTASFNARRSQTPANDVLQGAAVRSQLNQTGRATYNQLFDTGTEFQTAYTTVKASDNSAFATFNPSISQTLQVQLTQPLLRGRGRDIQRIPYMIAESRLDQTEAQVRQQVILLLFQAENDYWDAISARERLKVQQNNLDLAKAFLDRSQRELDLGAISPLDIYQPQQQYATAQVGVTQQVYTLQQAEDAVRRQIGADLDPDFRSIPLVLTESADPPTDAPTFDKDEMVAVALHTRPEIEQFRRTLHVDDLQIKQATNDLRPDLSINGLFSSTGRGGNFYDRSLTGDDGTVTFIPGGLGDALTQLLDYRFPTYSVGLTLQLPLRNRRAAADLSDASIQKKRDLYQLRSVEQDIRLAVVQAVAGVELSKASIQQALVVRDFAQKRLDAEQKKYDLGVNTAFIVLDAQDGLVQSEASLVNEVIAYRRALLALYRSTGELLEQRGVQIRYD